MIVTNDNRSLYYSSKNVQTLNHSFRTLRLENPCKEEHEDLEVPQVPLGD